MGGGGPQLTSSDRLLRSAAASVRIACAAARQSNRCRYCWLPRPRCICGAVRESVEHERRLGCGGRQPGRPARAGYLHWVILSHPHEFLRSTSTAKLAPHLLGGNGHIGRGGDGGGGGGGEGGGCGKRRGVGEEGGDEGDEGEEGDTAELLVFGAACHNARLEQLLRDTPALAVLFPEAPERSASVEAVLREAFMGRGKGNTPTGAGSVALDTADDGASYGDAGSRSTPPSGGSGRSPRLTVLVPDGTWEWARALVRHLEVWF